MAEPVSKGGHAGPMALENVVKELVEYGKWVEQHRQAVEAMERRPIEERIKKQPCYQKEK